MGFESQRKLVRGFFCVALFFSGNALFRLITGDRKYLARRWIVTGLWDCMAIYIILTDGEFAKSPIALVTAGVAGLAAMVFIFEDSQSLTAKLSVGKNTVELSKANNRANQRVKK